ncbi:hypothetical protein C5L39_03400 [Corynebacterium alimapuense]|uniref:Uncharacterized protein n=1 Tax=Corynebacterium alimapuense TaxID=1576874 RepID=A0A3M8K871_9CORY|nr:hypothetical protein C5L39_03400 [Corynebacterium alimapuense]
MNNDGPQESHIEISPSEARALLEEVETIEKSVAWKPNSVVSVLVALTASAVIVVSVWDFFGWTFGLLAITGILAFLFRKQLINPHIRARPWQRLDQDIHLKGNKWWIDFGWFLWLPVIILLPSEPRWPGLIAGPLAGLFIYYYFKNAGLPR